MDDIERLLRADYPPDVVAEADMVMKGGITSGVVYPLAVCELAQRYRFRSVGGSSAGGIAAAFAAAAEYRRSVAPERSGDGFRELAALPQQIGAVLGDLFQPSTGTRAAFEALVVAADRRLPKLTRAGRVLRGVLRAARCAAGLGALAVVLTAGCGLLLAAGVPRSSDDALRLAAGLVPALPLAAAAALVVATVVVARNAVRGITENGYGMCIGSGTPTGATKPFTDWMHERLNAVAGKPPAQPLTFGDLWGPDAADPQVRLEMMTTNVTWCRPTRVPFADDTYLFCVDELRRWFPPEVMAAMTTRELVAEDGTCPDHGTPLRRLPEPPDLPVVVAVRLSLSFPALISPVPLFARDFSGGERRLVRCHFSDGGISSNFPIHFFDSLWPTRPTFGVTVGPYPPGRQRQPYYVPDAGTTRVPRVRDTSTFGKFLSAIADTAQNWSDEGQSMLPGYSDRIVEIHLDEHEGGMNLAMSRDQVLDLARRGAEAGRELCTRFDFERHRWKRYLTAMAELQEAVTAMAGRYDDPPGYREFVAARRDAHDWRAGFVSATDWLLTFAGRTPPDQPWRQADFRTVAPRPEPDLRITPHF